MDEPRDCKRCGEDAVLIGGVIRSLVRVRRFSHCKNYIAPGSSKSGADNTCQTGLHDDKESAIREWNEKFGAGEEVGDEKR